MPRRSVMRYRGIRTKNVRAIVFDLDRTLIISQSGFNKGLWVAAEEIAKSLERKGRLVAKERVYRIVRPVAQTFEKKGLYGRDEWWEIVLERLGLSEAKGRWIHDVTLRYWDAYIKWGPPYSDAEETLRTLKNWGYRLGMVTDTDGTPGIKMKRVRTLRFYRLFETVVVAGEDTPRIKPSKAPFILVAKRLSVQPEHCVYVGDNPKLDVRGARAVGMQTILVKRRRMKGDRPDLMIKSLRQLLSVFRPLKKHDDRSPRTRVSVG